MSDFVFGLIISAIGMVLVFIIIIFLIGIMYLLKFLLNKKERIKTQGKTGIEPKIVAAIAAGVAVYLDNKNKVSDKITGEEAFGHDAGFIVKNIKKR